VDKRGPNSPASDPTGDPPLERALGGAEEQHRLLMECVTDYAIFFLDPHGRVAAWNAGAERILGYRESEALGEPFHRFFTPEDLHSGQPEKELQTAARTGRANDDRWLVRKDGTRLWCSGVTTALRDEEDRLRGFAKVVRDLSERRRADETSLRLAALVESCEDAIIGQTLEGLITTWNQGAERLFGYTAEEVRGKPVSLLRPSDLPDELPGIMARLRRGERIEHYDTVRVSKDGQRLDVSVTISPINDANGRIVGASAITRDISERKRAERRRIARLAATQVLAEATTVHEAAPGILRAICESLGWDAGALWGVDADAGVLRCLEVWHQAAVRMTGFEAACRRQTFRPGVGLPGRVWSSGQPAWIPDVGQDDNFPRALVASGEGLHGAFGCPIRLGKEPLAVIEFFSHEVRQPDEDLLEMMATISSQVGLFMGRERVESLHRRFVSLVENSSEFIGLATAEGAAFFVNEAGRRLVGLDSLDEVRRTQVVDYFPPEDRPRIQKEVLPVVLRDGRWSGEVRFRHFKTGATIPVVWNVVCLKDQTSGQPLALACISSDVTDRKRLEEALHQRAEELAQEARQKDDFLAVLAHELRNPLAPVRNVLQVIRTASHDAALVEQMGAMAERQVGYMTHLVDDLLDLSRISRGLMRLLREPLDVAQPVQQAVEGVQPLVRERGLTLSVSLPPEPVVVDADPTRLQQVVGNLLSNAAKYTDPGGTILLTARQKGSDLVLRVRDTGIGIPPDMLPRIFDLFVQAERRLDRSQGGLGIGLTLVRQLVEMHGGTVTAHSDGPGKGSEFVVRLPTLTAEQKGELLRKPPEAQHPVARTAPRRILVVDDNVDAAESLAVLLRLEGHQVRVACDGPAALAAAQTNPPEMVVLDLGMPGMDGFEVARRLRALPATKDTLLVAMTGWAQEEDRRRCSEAGFDGHLPKPVEWDALRQFLAHPKLLRHPPSGS
jgi:two-component system CheB/CheR fusion protein